MSFVGAPTAESSWLDRDRWPSIWLRRAITIPATAVMLGIALVCAPLWIPVAALVDLLGPKGRCTLRCGLFLTWYLICESAGILSSAVLYAAALLRRGEGPGGPAHRDALFRLQRRWAAALLDGAARIFGFRIIAEGTEHLDRPMLLLLRHASVADTLLASELISRPHAIHLRYVLKRELLWDPCLDIVGNRLPNYFARRDSADSEREIRGIRSLMTGLSSHEGVLIYPEGTRFSQVKRERVLERLRAGGHADLAARAEKLRHTLPPRLGGTLALLEANPGLDVVVGVHTGLEGASSFWQLWNGALRAREVSVRFERFAAGDIPATREARIDWLFARWEEMDRWLAAQAEADRSTGDRA